MNQRYIWRLMLSTSPWWPLVTEETQAKRQLHAMHVRSGQRKYRTMRVLLAMTKAYKAKTLHRHQVILQYESAFSGDKGLSGKETAQTLRLTCEFILWQRLCLPHTVSM